MRLVGRVLLSLVLVAGLAYAAAWASTSRSGLARSIAWLGADTGDLHRFPSRAVPAGDEAVELRQGAPIDLAGLLRVDDPEAWFEQADTVAFLVLQDGALRYEGYFGGASADELRTSFSVAKSVVSTLIGLAVEDGHIASVDDPVTAYVPELVERDRRYEGITIRHLMTMSSGLRYEERSLPWSDDSVTYYGTDLRATALSSTIEEEPGRRFLYNNFNPLIEGLVLERATGMSVSEYLSQRLWQPMGAEADASWSLDSTASGFEKMESGLNAILRDYARFGLVFARGGRAGERQVVPEEWVRQATSAEAGGPADFYGFHWWTGRSDGTPFPEGAFMAAGNHGQFVYVAPARDVVIVRLGDSDGDVDWPTVISRLAQDLDGTAP